MGVLDFSGTSRGRLETGNSREPTSLDDLYRRGSAVEGSERILAQLGSFNVVQLLTESAVKREARFTGHDIDLSCNAFDAETINNEDIPGDLEVWDLSVRNTEDIPLATLKIIDGYVVCLWLPKKGAFLDKAGVQLLAAFLIGKGWKPDSWVSRLGWVVDDSGTWHACGDLPDGLKISGDLDLRPNGGRGDVIFCTVPHLGNNTSISGNLVIGMCELSELPKGLSVGKDFDLSYNTSVPSIPDDIRITGNINLSNSQIDNIPDNLFINGDLDLWGSRVSFLPENLKVKGDLNLGSSVAQLPSRLAIGGSLNINRTKIRILPDDLTVGGSMDLSKSALAEWSRDEITVFGDLTAEKTKINYLPKCFTIKGNLDLSSVPINRLSDRLIVGGFLRINETLVTKLPPFLILGGSLYARSSALDELPNKLTINGDLDLRSCPITSLPNRLIVRGDLAIANSEIKSLPVDLVVHGSLYLGENSPVPESECFRHTIVFRTSGPWYSDWELAARDAFDDMPF